MRRERLTECHESLTPIYLQIRFAAGNFPGRSDWALTGDVSLFSYRLNADNYKACVSALESKKKNPGNYSKDNQCTSAAVDIVKACGVKIPNDGRSKVSAGPMTYDLPNPYGLSKVLDNDKSVMSINIPASAITLPKP